MTAILDYLFNLFKEYFSWVFTLILCFALTQVVWKRRLFILSMLISLSYSITWFWLMESIEIRPRFISAIIPFSWNITCYLSYYLFLHMKGNYNSISTSDFVFPIFIIPSRFSRYGRWNKNIERKPTSLDRNLSLLVMPGTFLIVFLIALILL